MPAPVQQCHHKRSPLMQPSTFPFFVFQGQHQMKYLLQQKTGNLHHVSSLLQNVRQPIKTTSSGEIPHDRMVCCIPLFYTVCRPAMQWKQYIRQWQYTCANPRGSLHILQTRTTSNQKMQPIKMILCLQSIQNQSALIFLCRT